MCRVISAFSANAGKWDSYESIGVSRAVMAVAAILSLSRPEFASGQLYGTAASGSVLYSVNKSTAAATEIGVFRDQGNSTVAFGKLVSDPLGQLFGISASGAVLHSINKLTAAATEVGVFRDSAQGNSAVYLSNAIFDPSGQLLYGSAASGSVLYSVNKLTAAATEVGVFRDPAQGNSSVYLSNLTFAVIPEPSTTFAAVLGIATGVICLLRRRARRRQASQD